MLTADTTTIELGRLCTAGVTTTGPRQQLIHLPEQSIVVMPYSRTRTGWECAVVASRAPRRVHHVHLTDEQIQAADTTITARPDTDPEGYARLVWASQAFRHWPGGRPLALVQYIVDELRPRGSIHVTNAALDDHNRIARILPNTRPPAVRPLLDQITGAGLLTRASPDQWRLTLPAPTARS